MPELPEVETVRRGLRRLIVGKKIASVSHDWPKSFPNPPAEVDNFLIGAEVTAVRRRAKVLLIDLSSNYTLVTHLKMTGQLVYAGAERFGAGHPNDSLVGSLPDRSTRVIVKFSDDSHLFFNDQRKFGWMRLMPTLSVPEIDFMKRVGPEPLEDDFIATVFFERLARRKNTSIKGAILDQSIVAGIGNIYADESLWGAKIHPARLVKTVTQAEVSRLTREIKAILALSIAKGGSTDRNYVDAEGQRGSYLSFANVFRREGQPCPRCQSIIKKTRVAGRGTHYCPSCQPEQVQ